MLNRLKAAADEAAAAAAAKVATATAAMSSGEGPGSPAVTDEGSSGTKKKSTLDGASREELIVFVKKQAVKVKNAESRAQDLENQCTILVEEAKATQDFLQSAGAHDILELKQRWQELTDEASMMKEPATAAGDSASEKKIAQLTETLKRYKENGALAVKKIKALTAERDKWEGECAELRQQLEANAASLDGAEPTSTSDTIIEDLQMQLSNRDAEIEQLRDSTQPQQESDNARLAKERLDALQDELDTVQNQLAEEKERGTELRNRLESNKNPSPQVEASSSEDPNDGEISRLKEELKQERASITAVQAELAGVHSELESVKQDLQETNAKSEEGDMAEKSSQAKLVKLQKLLRRAEQMLAENKKQMKQNVEKAEQDRAKIVALEAQIKQMSARGVKGDLGNQISPTNAKVHARTCVLDTVWCFLTPNIGVLAAANGIWMRQADFAAEGGNTESLPLAIEEAAAEKYEARCNDKLAEHSHKHGAVVRELESEIKALTKSLEEERLEFANYKKRATSVLKKKTAQLSELCSDDSSVERLKEQLSLAEQQQQQLESEKTAVEKDCSEKADCIAELQELINKGAEDNEQWRQKLQHLQETEGDFESRCLAAEEKQAKMIKELEVAIQSEQERCENRCEELRQEHQAYRTKVKKMMHEKDMEITTLRERAKQSNSSGPAAAVVEPPQHIAPPPEVNKEGQEMADLIRAARVQAQRDEEVSKYQTQIRELEKGVKEGDRVRTLLSEQVNALKEEIKRQDRQHQRDHAPMEYLKNIVISYMETGNHDQLMPVLTTLLQLTPQEIEQVNRARASRWF